MEEEPNEDGDEESFVAPNEVKPNGSSQSVTSVGEGGSNIDYKGVGSADTGLFKENFIKKDIHGSHA